MKISLVSNNSGTSKIHFVVVLVDMAGDLGVMVEHSPFVFCNPGFQWSFSLTVVYKTLVSNVVIVHIKLVNHCDHCTLAPTNH